MIAVIIMNKFWNQRGKNAAQKNKKGWESFTFCQFVVLIWFFVCLFSFFPLEVVSAFSWEPGGCKFAVIHGESPRISASFYSLEKEGSVTLQSK